MELSLIQQIAVYALPVIFAITVHEAAHGYAARYFGDMTAYQAGRITLNPLKHIDPIGTIVVPAMAIALGGVLFGWAKPVPVNYGALRKPKKDMLWVALAGPAANLGMAVFWLLLLKFSAAFPVAIVLPLSLMCKAGVMINIVLMVLNMLPLPPLDGGRIMVSLLPRDLAQKFSQIERYGFVILMVLLMSGVLSKIMNPLIALSFNALDFFFG